MTQRCCWLAIKHLHGQEYRLQTGISPLWHLMMFLCGDCVSYDAAVLECEADQESRVCSETWGNIPQRAFHNGLAESEGR